MHSCRKFCSIILVSRRPPLWKEKPGLQGDLRRDTAKSYCSKLGFPFCHLFSSVHATYVWQSYCIQLHWTSVVIWIVIYPFSVSLMLCWKHWPAWQLFWMSKFWNIPSFCSNTIFSVKLCCPHNFSFSALFFSIALSPDLLYSFICFYTCLYPINVSFTGAELCVFYCSSPTA